MMLQMLMQPRQVALHDEPQRFCVVFQPYDNLAVSFPARDGSDGSVGAPRRGGGRRGGLWCKNSYLFSCFRCSIGLSSKRTWTGGPSCRLLRRTSTPRGPHLRALPRVRQSPGSSSHVRARPAHCGRAARLGRDTSGLTRLRCSASDQAVLGPSALVSRRR